MNRCVSYSYFRSPASVYEKLKGNAARQFEQFLPLLVRAHWAIWPMYDLIIHTDEDVTELPYYCTLEAMAKERLLKLVPMGNIKKSTLCGAMMWRMRPIWNSQYDVVVCRDIDSIPSLRDRRAVSEFVHGSEAAVHTIHDNPAHSGLMGGTLAVKTWEFKKLTGFATIEDFEAEAYKAFPVTRWNEHGTDQHFLNQVIYPRLQGSVLVHELVKLKPGLEMADHRYHITSPIPQDVGLAVIEQADLFSSGIGVCDEPAQAFSFYDSFEGGAFDKIKECERS